MPKLHALSAEAKRRQEFERRIQRQKKIIQPVDVPEGVSREGAMQKADHLAGLTPEGVAGEILTIWIFNALMVLFNVHYIAQERQFEMAEQEGLAYKAKQHGNIFPRIYPIGPDGQPDFSATPNTDGTAPAELVIANGYVPPADMTRAFVEQWKQYEIQMWGNSKTETHDVASDMAAMRRPTPK